MNPSKESVETKSIGVVVKFFGSFREKTGKKMLEILVNQRSSVLDVTKKVDQILDTDFQKILFSERDEVIAPYSILLNGKRIQFTGGIHTIVKDGDTIAIFAAVAGGGLDELLGNII